MTIDINYSVFLSRAIGLFGQSPVGKVIVRLERSTELSKWHPAALHPGPQPRLSTVPSELQYNNNNNNNNNNRVTRILLGAMMPSQNKKVQGAQF